MVQNYPVFNVHTALKVIRSVLRTVLATETLSEDNKSDE